MKQRQNETSRQPSGRRAIRFNLDLLASDFFLRRLKRPFFQRTEAFTNRVIGRGHRQCLKLVRGYPSEVVTSDGFERAFLNSATIDQKKDWISWIGIIGYIKNHPHLHLDI
jgi:hypothetical protein